MKNIPEKDYKKVMKIMPIPCVDIVIHSGKKFLMCKRANHPAKGHWWLPGGRIYKGETNERAAIRKAIEETGMKVKIEKLIGANETIFNKGPFGTGKVHTINIQYLAKPISGKFDVKLDDQSDEYRIFDKIEKSWHPYLKDVIKKSGILEK